MQNLIRTFKLFLHVLLLNYVFGLFFPLVFLSPPGWLGSRCGPPLPGCQDINSHCWNGVCQCHSGFKPLNGACRQDVNKNTLFYRETTTTSSTTSAPADMSTPQSRRNFCPDGWEGGLNPRPCYPGKVACPFGSYCTAKKGLGNINAVCCKPAALSPQLCNGHHAPLFDAWNGDLIECGKNDSACPLGYACQVNDNRFICCTST